jgi:hypothetical protein
MDLHMSPLDGKRCAGFLFGELHDPGGGIVVTRRR